MAILETIGLILTSQTAGSVAKFLYEKVEGYIREKLGGKPPSEVEDLKNQIEELKNKIESKEKEEITSTEVDELKKTVQHIEQNNSPIPAAVISVEVFKKWSESDKLDPEEQALLIRNQLEIVIDKAGELGIKEKKRFEIQDALVFIDQKIVNLKEARSTARLTGFREDKEEEKRIEMLLRRNVLQAKDLLKGY